MHNSYSRFGYFFAWAHLILSNLMGSMAIYEIYYGVQFLDGLVYPGKFRFVCLVYMALIDSVLISAVWDLYKEKKNIRNVTIKEENTQ